MLNKLAAVEARYNELSNLMSSPEVTSKSKLLMKYGQEQSGLGPVVEAYHSYSDILSQLDDVQEMLAEELDDEMKAMAREEQATLEQAQKRLEQKLQAMLLPKDSNDKKNVRGL